MRRAGTTYCDVCAVEIPEGEPTNEFDLSILEGKGHAHGECVDERNKAITQYEEIVAATLILLDPEIDTANRAHFAERAAARRADKVLKRVEKRRQRELRRETERQEKQKTVKTKKKKVRRAA